MKHNIELAEEVLERFKNEEQRYLVLSASLNIQKGDAICGSTREYRGNYEFDVTHVVYGAEYLMQGFCIVSIKITTLPF